MNFVVSTIHTFGKVVDWPTDKDLEITVFIRKSKKIENDIVPVVLAV